MAIRKSKSQNRWGLFRWGSQPYTIKGWQACGCPNCLTKGHPVTSQFEYPTWVPVYMSRGSDDAAFQDVKRYAASLGLIVTAG